jgi:hypothetical protein
VTNRRRGSDWENAVVAYLRDNGFPKAERAYGAGRPVDVGDIDGIPGVVLECKYGAYALTDMHAHIDQVGRARAVTDAELGIVIAKRRNRGTGDAYFCLPLYQGAALLRRAYG